MDMTYVSVHEKIYKYINELPLNTEIWNTKIRQELNLGVEDTGQVSSALSQLARYKIITHLRNIEGSREKIYEKSTNHKFTKWRNLKAPVKTKKEITSAEKDARDFLIEALDAYIGVVKENAIKTVSIDDLLNEIKRRT